MRAAREGGHGARGRGLTRSGEGGADSPGQGKHSPIETAAGGPLRGPRQTRQCELGGQSGVQVCGALPAPTPARGSAPPRPAPCLNDPPPRDSAPTLKLAPACQSNAPPTSRLHPTQPRPASDRQANRASVPGNVYAVLSNEGWKAWLYSPKPFVIPLPGHL